MSNKKDDVLKVVKLVVEFIDKLTEEEINGIIDGKVKFYIEGKQKIASKVKEIENFDEIVSRINSIENREEATEYIKSLKLTNVCLISLGSKFGITIKKSYKKEKIISTIVESVVGNRLKVEGLRSGILGGE